MILLITPSGRGQECGKAVEEATSQPVHVVESLHQAVIRLRAQQYSAVVIDQSLLELEPDQSEMVLQHIGTAIPVHINFAISGIERVVRELRAALHRRKREELVARQAAEQVLCSELKDAVTAMLLFLRTGVAGTKFACPGRGENPHGSSARPGIADAARALKLIAELPSIAEHKRQ